MKKISYLLVAAFALAGITAQAQVKIGNNPTTIGSSSALELESTDKGLVVTRVANTGLITAPVNGMIVYDTSANCLKAYENGAWSGCLSSGAAGGSNGVSNNCDANGFAGSYVGGVALSGASFSVTITNNSLSNTTLSFASGDLVLSGLSGISVGTPSPASVTLNPGQAQLVTYPLTGTPATAGTLTATWTKLSLTCTKTKVVGNGDAVFAASTAATVVSIAATPGVIDNATKKLIVNVPYTSGAGSYSAYTSSSAVTTVAGQAGDVNGLTISYPAGTFSATGTIPVTVIVDGDQTYNVKQLATGITEAIATLPFMVNGQNKGNIVLNAVGGCSVKVSATEYKQFMCHNLGADTSLDPNVPVQGIHGNYYQWGRSAVVANASTPAAAISGWNTTNAADGAWLDASKTANDPCPAGFRVPTKANFDGIAANNTISFTGTFTSSATNFGAAAHYGPDASTKVLTLPAAGYRFQNDGALNARGTDGNYWCSGVFNLSGQIFYFTSSGGTTGFVPRARGNSIRCIAE